MKLSILKVQILLILVICHVVFLQQNIFAEEPAKIIVSLDQVREKIPQCVNKIREMSDEAENRVSEIDKAIAIEEQKETIRRHLRKGDETLDSGDHLQARQNYQKAASLAKDAARELSL